MAVFQGRSKRKATGGRYHDFRKVKKYELGREIILSKISDKDKIKKINSRGGVEKHLVLTAKTINVANPKDKSVKKAQLEKVVENNANPQFVRMNVLTKGAIVQTNLGLVKITSRPGQSGSVCGVLVEN